MKIVIAPDSFKGSLKAAEAAKIMANAVTKVLPEADLIKLPLSDGGEGLVSVLTGAIGGEIKRMRVTGPAGKPVDSFWGLLPDGITAVMEAAAASGFSQLKPEDRNPLDTTTYGLGELVRAALDHGCSRIIIGAGGSATNDGGSGLAQALGVVFLDQSGNSLQRGGGSLDRLASIDISAMDRRINDVEVIVACDVDNPLTGPRGASYTFAPQKGASFADAEKLDRALARYAQIIERQTAIRVNHIPGSGAAGGLGAGLAAFCNARLTKGIDLVMDLVQLDRYLESADLLLTGEGRLDDQSTFGKVPVGVARRAHKFGVPVAVIAGSIPEGERQGFYDLGITAVFSTACGPITLEESMEKAGLMLFSAVEDIMRLWIGASNRFSRC